MRAPSTKCIWIVAIVSFVASAVEALGERRPSLLASFAAGTVLGLLIAHATVRARWLRGRRP